MPDFNTLINLANSLDPNRDQCPIPVRTHSLEKVMGLVNNNVSIRAAWDVLFQGRDHIELSRNGVRNTANNPGLFVLSVLIWGFPTNQHGAVRYVLESWDNVIQYTQDILDNPSITSERFCSHFVPFINKTHKVALAFFSKLMYFARATIDGCKCAILDNFVYHGINCIHDNRLDRLRESVSRYRNKYESYADYVINLSELNEDTQLQVEIDRLEYAFFIIGKG
ncbi:MAG: hypothetical protein J6T04_07190 [Bacteroidales bacterium]|nr:hypothetical protein [Bacteroidales bacterium]